MIQLNKYLCLCWMLCLGIATNAQVPKVSVGTIKHFPLFQSRYVAARNVDVWLPEGYNPRKKYAVLYMQDGRALFDASIMWNGQTWGIDKVVQQLLTQKKIRDCIVVGIWNGEARRHSEYFPGKVFASLDTTRQKMLYQAVRADGTTIFATPIVSDNYLKFIVYELKPFIDSSFSTHKDRKNTFIAGSSMGGMISLYAICEYPDIFGGAACLSTHWTGISTAANNPIPEAMMKYLKAKLPSPGNHKIYFDHGDKTLDTLYQPFQLQADKIMRSKGYSSKNWMSKVFAGADHTEASWNRRVDIPITFLLKP